MHTLNDWSGLAVTAVAARLCHVCHSRGWRDEILRFSLLWLWSWPDNLDIPGKTKDSEDAPAYQKWTFLVEAFGSYGALQTDRETDRQTDATERITTPHSRVINMACKDLYRISTSELWAKLKRQFLRLWFEFQAEFYKLQSTARRKWKLSLGSDDAFTLTSIDYHVDTFFTFIVYHFLALTVVMLMIYWSYRVGQNVPHIKIFSALSQLNSSKHPFYSRKELHNLI